jgi:phosphatidylserine/phosphatidylglycerophosphate/cardiolipin synthase-like enzyme|nr:phospholipase D-like domain-containing protein [Caldimonas sp.]
MNLLHASFAKVACGMVHDGQYHPTVVRLLRNSESRCHCSVFIVDHDLRRDVEFRVDSVLVELASAAWRGVDVKLLIGGSRRNREIRDSALLARARARDLGIDVRLAAASKKNESHAKLVVTDRHVLLGSHNWSRGMFGTETQDSVLLESSSLAAALDTYFAGSWLKAARDEYDVSF